MRKQLKELEEADRRFSQKELLFKKMEKKTVRWRLDRSRARLHYASIFLGGTFFCFISFSL